MSETGQSYRKPDEPNPPFVYPDAWLRREPVMTDTMVITAALCWWNELPADLERCIAGAANIADRVMALDGAYRRYPGASVRSDERQHDAIRRAAKKAGMECKILVPDTLWAGQVEKRSYLLAMAAIGSDWIVTLDADHVISTDRKAVRAELRNSTAFIVDVPFVTPLNQKRSLKQSAVGQWHIEQTREPQMIPQVWRADLGLRVEQRHWWISATKGGEKVWAWAGDTTRRKLPHAAFVTPYTVEHRSMLRTPEQIRASRAFCNDREMVVAKTGQEDDVPGLPAPKFDYDRMPV